MEKGLAGANPEGGEKKIRPKAIKRWKTFFQYSNIFIKINPN
jgi:hypothetical protein